MAPVNRDHLLRRLAEHLVELDPGHPLRVGVDGVCGSGKTTFARDLAAALGATPASHGAPRPVVPLDSDGFHHVRERR